MQIEGQNDGTSDALTVDSARSVIEGLLSDESEDPQTRETPPASEDTPSDEELEPDADSAAEPADDDEGESTDDGDEPDEHTPAPQSYTVKIDGKDETVTLDELLKGYSRTADYTRKTQELAAKRKQFEESELPAVQRERQEYATRLIQLEQAIQAVTPQEPDWDTLRRQDPAAFAETWAAWQQHKERLARIAAERQKAEERVRQDQQQKHQAYLTAQRDALLEALPEWKDPEKAKAEKAELIAYAKNDLGFTDQEVQQVYDHRLLLMLRKAMLYDKAQKAKPVVQQKIEKVRAATPGSPKANQPKVSETTRRKQRLAKTGSVIDAAAVLETLL